jgi:hypothetical protein
MLTVGNAPSDRPAEPRAPWSPVWPWVLAFVVLAVLYLQHATNVLNTPVYTGNDGWIFNSEFVQVSRGVPLYSGVWDHKDPVYYYVYSIFERLFGLTGPMICETLISLGMTAVLLAIARRLRLPALVATACTGICLLYLFSPNVYWPMNTYPLALLLFFTSVLLALYGRLAVAGGVFAAAVFANMPMAAFGPAALAIPVVSAAPDWSSVWHSCRAWIIGAAAFTIILVLALLVRDELFGYIQVIQGNFAYSSLLQATVGIVNHPFYNFENTVGRLCAFVMVGLVAILSFIVVLRVIRQLKAVRDPIDNSAQRELTGVTTAAVLAGAAGAVILYVASYFVDYFECLTPLFFLLPVSFASLLRTIDLGFGHRFQRITLRGPPLAVAGVLALAVVMILSGFVTPAALAGPPQQMSLAFVTVNSVDPAVSTCIDKYPFAHQSTTFASIGTNGFVVGCLVPPNMHLACALMDQFPSEGSSVLDEFRSCLAARPQIVFVEPLLYFTGSYASYETELLATLHAHFQMIGSCGPEEIWQRKPIG